MTYDKKYILMVLILFLTWESRAQEKMEMSLDGIVEQAISNNWQVRRQESDLGMAKADLMQANAAFLPSINISETYINTTDPLNVFGFKLKQEIVSESDFMPSLLNNPDDFENFATRVSVEQPLINLDAITARKAAAAKRRSAEYSLQWTRNLIELHAKHQYYNLQLARKQKQILEKSREAITESYRVSKNLFDEGLVLQVHLLDVEMRKYDIETKIIEAENQINDANLHLTHFLGLGSEVEIIPTDSIENANNVIIDTTGIEVSDDRSDLQALSFQLMATEQSLSSAKLSFLPRLNAFGTYEWNEDEVFGTMANNYLVGARLEWDVFKGGRNIGSVQKVKHQNQMVQLAYDEKLSQSKRDLISLKQQIKLSQKQIDLARKAVTHAKEVYKIKSDRYAEGLEKTADILLAESNLLNKRMAELQTLNTQRQLLFKLELLLEKDIIK